MQAWTALHSPIAGTICCLAMTESGKVKAHLHVSDNPLQAYMHAVLHTVLVVDVVTWVVLHHIVDGGEPSG